MPTVTTPRLARFAMQACAALLAAVVSGAVCAQRGSADPLEGKWLGTIGTPKERIVAGVEFRRDPDTGALKLLLTEPIMNYFGVDPGVGEVVRDGNKVTYAPLALSLTLSGDTLEGYFPGPNSPASLERVDALPTEQSPPRVPAGPEPLWQARLGGQVFANPAVVDGVVYIGTSGGVMNAIDASDGRIVWAYDAGRPILGEAAVSDDAVYFACDDGRLYRLTRADGKLAWRYELGDGNVPRAMPHPSFGWDLPSPLPLLAEGIAYVGAGDGSFHAVDAASGARRWRFDTGGRIRGGAALDGERVVFGSADGFVYSLERGTGRELWRFDTGAPVNTVPLLHEGKVLVGNRGYGLYSLNAADGQLAWKLYFWGSWVESVPVVVGDTIYIGSSDLRRVSAIELQTGKVRWRTDVFGWNWGTPLVDGDRLHVGVAGGTPYFVRHVASYTTLDRHTGKILTRRPLPDAGGYQWGISGSPVRSGNSVIVATIEGSLYAYPLR